MCAFIPHLLDEDMLSAAQIDSSRAALYEMRRGGTRQAPRLAPSAHGAGGFARPRANPDVRVIVSRRHHSASYRW